MPRIARASAGGICYHVINRGNGGQAVFHEDADYDVFLKAIAHACIEVPMRVLGYCLMPNHFHLIVWPESDGDLSRWMHWVLNTHVRRYHQQYHGSGHIWQGRAFPIEANKHLLTVLRYAEHNPVRARLVKRAELWLPSSAGQWGADARRPSFLVPGPSSEGLVVVGQRADHAVGVGGVAPKRSAWHALRKPGMDREDGNPAGPDGDIAAARPTEENTRIIKMPVTFFPSFRKPFSERTVEGPFIGKIPKPTWRSLFALNSKFRGATPGNYHCTCTAPVPVWLI